MYSLELTRRELYALEVCVRLTQETHIRQEGAGNERLYAIHGRILAMMES